MAQLKKTLGPVMIWGLGVGYVISGMYFGWNLGLEKGGTLGLAIATGVSILLYITFTFSYAELACAIPRAGGAFDYAARGLGRHLGFIAGMAQIIEFLFAPPAIALAIGTYFHIFFPQVPVPAIATLAYVVFTLLNILGVRAAALFELIITCFAVVELLIFAGLTLPHFNLSRFQLHSFPNGWAGAWAAIPFAIWFFLGLEGVANVAEEAVNPNRDIRTGFSSALITLVLLCVLVFVSATGVGGWEKIVYPSPGEAASDKPLPLALAQITSSSGAMYHLLVSIGIMGLVASFHGIVLAAGRASFEFGKMGYWPRWMGKVHPRFKTPANALVANSIIGIVALFSKTTDQLITISVFGALTLYVISMISLLALRKKEPGMPRPFRVPAYPVFPVVALIIAGVFLLAMISLNVQMALIYFSLLAIAYLWFYFFVKPGEHA